MTRHDHIELERPIATHETGGTKAVGSSALLNEAAARPR